MDFLESFLTSSWLVLGEMAPYLLLGFLVAGVLSVCVSPAWVERHLGGAGLGAIVKASLFGVPLPLCSCGVIPVGASIHRHGASRGATTAFLLSTPQTGVDSIAVTYALLGPAFAVFRPIAALITGLIGGGVVRIFENARPEGNGPDSSTTGCQGECCSNDARGNMLARIARYGFITLPRDIGGSLFVGILIAGLIGTFFHEGQLNAYFGVGLFSILLMMAVGVPLYVCATASVPIAAGFIHAGASPGAALAFLIAGPATNAATITTIWRLLGRRTALIYLATVAISAIVCGLLLDGIYAMREIPIRHLPTHDHAAMAGGWPAHAWAIALLAIMMASSKTLARFLRRTGLIKEPHGVDVGHGASGAPSDSDEREIVLVVTGMTCGHCAESVRRALAACEGVRSAQVDLVAGRARVIGPRLDAETLVAAVVAVGYRARLVEEGIA